MAGKLYRKAQTKVCFQLGRRKALNKSVPNRVSGAGMLTAA